MSRIIHIGLPSRRAAWRFCVGVAGATVLVCFVAVFAASYTLRQLGPIDLIESSDASTVVFDRDGKLLRAFTTDEGRWRLPIALDDVDPRYLSLLTTFEDRRYFDHYGVDPVAVTRAVWQSLRHGRLVSGASTLTMQVARLVERRHERSLTRKLRQMLRAIELERRFTKRQILELYLRLAPFGGNIEGIRAASLAYFGKEPKHLSLGQAALLVALPQSPESRRPDRSSKRAKRARDRVLETAFAAGVINRAELERAKAETVPTKRQQFPMLAPHLSEQELALFPNRKVHRTTLIKEAQSSLQALLRQQTRQLGDKLSSALLAIDNKSGEIIAYVGSSDYLDESRHGSIDMVQAIRSPGSTLKPLIYGMGFELGLAHPETLIEDRRVRFGNYSPENFDDRFHGAVTIKEALGLSLNIPAVKMLSAVGPTKFVSRLQSVDVKTELPDGARPSLAVALGGIGMRMFDLATLYTGLARSGEPVALIWRTSDRKVSKTHPAKTVEPTTDTRIKPTHVLDPRAAWYVTNILRDAPVPTNVRAGNIAYKTGTSYGYRDAWAVGYNGAYTIVVWVGRPDATSTPGMIGRTAAAPILFDAFQRLGQPGSNTFPSRPEGVITAKGADLPPPLKRFSADVITAEPGPYDVQNVEISFPPDRAELDFAERDGEPLVLKARGGALPLTWLVNGKPIESTAHQRTAFWTPDGAGFVNLSVIDAEGRASRVHVRLK